MFKSVENLSVLTLIHVHWVTLTITLSGDLPKVNLWENDLLFMASVSFLVFAFEE